MYTTDYNRKQKYKPALVSKGILSL